MSTYFECIRGIISLVGYGILATVSDLGRVGRGSPGSIQGATDAQARPCRTQRVGAWIRSRRGALLRDLVRDTMGMGGVDGLGLLPFRLRAGGTPARSRHCQSYVSGRSLLPFGPSRGGFVTFSWQFRAQSQSCSKTYSDWTRPANEKISAFFRGVNERNRENRDRSILSNLSQNMFDSRFSKLELIVFDQFCDPIYSDHLDRTDNFLK